MLKHEAGAIDGSDIEELHDMRVAVRRLRAAVQLFRPYLPRKRAAALRKDLRRLGRALGPARDCDVMLANLEAYRAALPADAREALDPLARRWRKQRKRARKGMLTYLASKRYDTLKRRIAAFMADISPPEAGASPPEPATATENGQAAALPAPGEPLVGAEAPRLIARRYAKLLGYGPSLHGASIETLHALRIDCKRLRYALEFLREILPPQAKAAIDDIKRAQDHLGEMNDAYVAGEALRRLLEKWQRAPDDTRHPPATRESLGGYLAYCDDRARSHAHTFPAVWQELTGHAFRRRLREITSTSP